VTVHLSDSELRDFCAGALAVEALLRVDDHLSECRQCRTRAAALEHGSQSIDQLRRQLDISTPHLSDDELQLFVRGQLTGGSKATAERHLDKCPICAANVEDLRGWAASSSSARLTWLAMAAAVLVAIVLPTIVWQMRGGRQETALSLAGLESLPQEDQAPVRAALRAGGAAIPPLLTELTGGRESLMGAARPISDSFELLAPVSTAVVDDRPLFEWQALDGANDYAVAVFNEGATLVTRSDVISATRWTPVDPLPRNRTYVWQVTAHRGRDTITVPVAPAPPAKFHVIDSHSADVLQRAERVHPQSHLMLGVLAMQAGVRDVAMRHLEQVSPNDRFAKVATQCLERLRAVGSAGRR
jgi:hypothetical protein